MNGKQVIKILMREGWTLKKGTGGGHHQLNKGGVKVSVPVHGSKDLKVGTLRNIEKQTGVKLS